MNYKDYIKKGRLVLPKGFNSELNCYNNKNKMSFICKLCSSIFTQKKSLNAHLENKRCKTGLVFDYIKLNTEIQVTKTQLELQKAQSQAQAQRFLLIRVSQDYVRQ